ncbi:MAG TPA: amidophosphoribosyltransferase [Candidatus Saccharimonadales bacterium]|nr:amidophosphoribosyltransferase [Candidatus Saccharimonadales bacterium]
MTKANKTPIIGKAPQTTSSSRAKKLLLPERPREKCGIAGAYGKGFEAARLVYYALWALQHRGQEASGISSSDGKVIRTHKGEGLVAHVYKEDDLEWLEGHLAIGHNRYGTSGGKGDDHAQPVVGREGRVALAHNGNLPSTKALETFFASHRIKAKGLNDSELMHKALQYYLHQGKTIEYAVEKCFPLFTGAFSLLIMTKNKLIALRDSKGVRPLSIGKLNGGFIVASETCALDLLNATYLRDVQPGEMVVIDKKGLHSYQLAPGEQKLDIFEFIYFARPDSVLLEKSVNEVRRNLGIQLAKESNIRADIVVPVPDSAIPAALGFAQESGIPFDHGLIKNRYIHRTFIQPDQHMREEGVKLKLNPLNHVFAGKDIVIVDDSIVRGTTSKELVSLLRKSGAKKVYMVISSPPIKYPDFYGIDTPMQKKLIAAQMTNDEIQEYIGVDKLYYLSYEGLLKAIGLPEELFSTAHFTGNYPVDLLERAEEIDFTIV